MDILSVYSPEFSAFGCIHYGYDCEPLLRVLSERPCPADVLYVPSDEELEALPVAEQLQSTLCGQMPIQIGFTNGHCRKDVYKRQQLYHHGSENFRPRAA